MSNCRDYQTGAVLSNCKRNTQQFSAKPQIRGMQRGTGLNLGVSFFIWSGRPEDSMFNYHVNL